MGRQCHTNGAAEGSLESDEAFADAPVDASGSVTGGGAMRRVRLTGAGVIALGLLLTPARSEAGAQSCLGTARPLVIIDETFVGVVNPEGVENQLRTSLCLPISDSPGILHDYDGFELGLYNYLSPVYDHQGVYAAIAPLSFFQLKAAASAVVIWPLPLDGAGYFGLNSYTDKHSDAELPSSRARSTYGFNGTFTAVLQGAVDLPGPHALVITDSLSADYWHIGDAGFYVNLRQDVVLRRSDWVVKNNALVMIETHLSSTVNLHVGINDDFTSVPASGYVGNILALFVSVPIRRENGSPRDIEPFVRLGAYTHHASRSGFQFFGGISVAWGKPVSATAPPAEAIVAPQ